jgi:glycosyltransferase involved in cell wall biosynthesis
MISVDQPNISIIMPVYNTEEFLSEAIESVINQSYKSWELICINDGSTDNCLNQLENFKEKESRIVVINIPHSGLASVARNNGLSLARGYFIVILDSDDKIEPDYLAKLIDRYKETKAEVILASTEFWDYERDIIFKRLYGINGDISQVITGKEAFLLSLDWKIGGFGLYTAGILKKIGYDTNGMNGDEYTTRLLFLNSEFVSFSNAKHFYRNNPNSTTKKFSAGHFTVLINNIRLYQLIKNNKFNQNIICFYKEKLFDSLMSYYELYFNYRRQFNFKEKNISKNILKNSTLQIAQEYLKPPALENNLRNSIYKFILSHRYFTQSYSLLLIIMHKFAALSVIIKRKFVENYK